jgi:4-amino-4-deoxy-L-arabinose transferase-like glycosyltransferase
MEATAVIKTQAPIAVSRWTSRMTLVLALAGVLFFARLSERALWSEEVRWAQIPREMQRSGDYLWPTINGHTYYDKPLGSYWLVLLASFFTGGVDETSARLPSALSGLGAVAMSMLIARRLYDDDTALWTGIILATSFSFVFFARNASTDVETIAGVLTVLWIYLRNEGKPAGWWTLLLWFVMALTSLTKGLLGFVLPILIIGLYSIASKPRDGRPWAFWENFNRWTLAAIPLSVLVFLGPFLLSIAAGGSTDGLAMVYRENIRRFFDPVNHRGPIYLYTYVIFMLLAPWSLLLPAALVQAHFTENKESRGRVFALAYFWGTFIFFTLSSSRRSYYLLPILPAGAFLIARLLATREALCRSAYAFLLVGFFLTGMTMLLSIAALLPAAWLFPEALSELPPLPCPLEFVAVWLISVVSIGYALMKLSPRRIAMSMGVIAFSFMAYLYLFALPATEIYRTQKPFADAVRQTIGSDSEKLALYGTREIVYYLDAPGTIAEYHTPERLESGIQTQSVRWVLLRRQDWISLNRKGNVLVEETVHVWMGAEAMKNKLLLVEVAP